MPASRSTPEDHSASRLEQPPSWALTYQAREYDPWSLTVDVIGLAVDIERQDLHGLLIVRGQPGPYQGMEAWPGGFVHWENDHTARAAALRELSEETGQTAPEYIQQLRTYDAYGRDPRQFAGHPDPHTGEWRKTGTRVVSKAYLALLRKKGREVRPMPRFDAASANWASVYDYLPWEDLRSPASVATLHRLGRDLRRWADKSPHPEERRDRHKRLEHCFSLSSWNEEQTPERWSLLLEAKLVAEAWRDRWGTVRRDAPRLLYGRPLAFDHREMLADALGRLRTLVKVTPAAMYALVEAPFKLSELQTAFESVGGRLLYDSNFRRVIAHFRAFVEPLEVREEPQGRGKPAFLYSFNEKLRLQRLDPPLNLPWRSGPP